MQYVPLTTHLNALAQLYQQCASLSERCDKLARGQDIINDDKKDQERIDIDYGQLVSQSQEVNQERIIESRSNSAIEINIVDEEGYQIDIKKDNAISKQTKKIRRTVEDKQQQIQCQKCKQIFKNNKQMRKHFERVHNIKNVKKVNKKLQQQVMIKI